MNFHYIYDKENDDTTVVSMSSCWVGSFSFELCCAGPYGVGLPCLGGEETCFFLENGKNRKTKNIKKPFSPQPSHFWRETCGDKMWNLKKERKERKEKNGKSSMWRNFVFFVFHIFFVFFSVLLFWKSVVFRNDSAFVFFLNCQLSHPIPITLITLITQSNLSKIKKQHQKSFSKRFQVDFCDFHFGENVQVDFIRFREAHAPSVGKYGENNALEQPPQDRKHIL